MSLVFEPPLQDQRKCSSLNLTGQVKKANSSYFALGQQSDIFEGNWTNPTDRKRVSEVLALKVFRGVPSNHHVSTDIAEKLLSHAQKWRKLCHKNVLSVYGIATDLGFMPCIVMPLCAKGNAAEAAPLIAPELESIIRDVAKGLEFLHSNSIIHGNVRGTNILIRNDGAACLADYDLVHVIGDAEFTSTNIAGAVRWTAPEVLESEELEAVKLPYSVKSDVYAFAMTIIELYTGKVPFQSIKHDSAVLFRVIKGERPERPSRAEFSDNLWRLMNQCWAQNAEDRPNVDTVIAVL